MSETTTTEDEQNVAAGDAPQVDDAATTTADESKDATQTDHTTGTDETVTPPVETDEDVEWLKNKGVDPSDTKAVAEAWRNAEREFHKTRQEASTKLSDATNEATTTGDAIADEMRQLKNDGKIRDFKDSLRDEGKTRDEIDEITDQMGELIVKKPYLSMGDLRDVYNLVQAGESEATIKAAEARGRDKAKAEITRAGAAATPKGTASGPSLALTPEQERLERFSTGW